MFHLMWAGLLRWVILKIVEFGVIVLMYIHVFVDDGVFCAPLWWCSVLYSVSCEFAACVSGDVYAAPPPTLSSKPLSLIYISVTPVALSGVPFGNLNKQTNLIPPR